MTEIGKLLDLDHTLAKMLFQRIRYPWEALKEISAFVREAGRSLDRSEYEEIDESIWAARDAVIFPSAYMKGPLIIGHETEIRHSAFIRGSAIIGNSCVIGNSTEVKNAVIFDNVQVPHFNYVGDSVLGYRSHLGAGAVTSNVKSDRSLVVFKCGNEIIETGLRKFGAVVGDRTEVGCNSVLNPGTVIGRDSIIYPTSCVRGFVPERHIFKNDGTIVKRDL